MKRVTVALALVAVAGLLTAIHADVKTTQKTALKLEGMLGRFLSTPKEGITYTVAVKGNRMSRLNDATGEIVDLTEEKVYQLDVKKKQYTVKTFAQLRQEWEDAKAKAEKQAQSGTPDEKQAAAPPQVEMETDVSVKETGEHKTIAGRETREVIMTVTMRQKGQTLEAGGGTVMTSDMWIAAEVAQLDELMDFEIRYRRAVYGGTFGMGDMQQMATLSAMLRGFSAMSDKMASEGKKMQGTPLATTTTMEDVKSAEQMKAASQPADQPQKPSGIGGMLGAKLGPKPAPPQQRTLTMTTSSEYLSIEPAATDADVAIPVGFKEKK